MRRFLVVLLVLASVGLAPPARAAEVCVPGEARLVASDPVSGRLHELTLTSDSLGGETRVRVLLPAGYESSGERYPVLYLLHGAGDTYETWTNNTDVEEATAPLDLIVVMPDGGRNADAGWYSDWANGAFCWESFHVEELVAFVDGHYRTTASRSGRGIAGLSMGGFGAMSYAARHPDLFSVAGSFSGAVDTADGGIAEAAAFKALNPYFGTPDDRVWGAYTDDEVTWRDHNPPDLSTNLRSTGLWFVTGNGVPAPGDNPPSGGAEAGVYPMNRIFSADLTLEEIDHTFRDRGYGTHQWHYWQQDLRDFLPVLIDSFGSPAPQTFDYRTAEASFDVYGWAFDVRRDVKEFVDLHGVSADGLTVRGSGTVEVLSAPLYEPGRDYEVATADEVVVARADGDGRLSFTVSLGPSHTAQQYTVEARLDELVDPGYWRTVDVTIRPAV